MTLERMERVFNIVIIFLNSIKSCILLDLTCILRSFGEYEINQLSIENTNIEILNITLTLFKHISKRKQDKKNDQHCLIVTLVLTTLLHSK